jgi:Family of unknown function (DUF5989)
MLVELLLVGALVIFAQSSAIAPFIYTLFGSSDPRPGGSSHILNPGWVAIASSKSVEPLRAAEKMKMSGCTWRDIESPCRRRRSI